MNFCKPGYRIDCNFIFQIKQMSLQRGEFLIKQMFLQKEEFLIKADHCVESKEKRRKSSLAVHYLPSQKVLKKDSPPVPAVLVWQVCEVNGQCQVKKCLQTCVKYSDSEHPVHTQSHLGPCSLHSIQWFCKWTVKALIRLPRCTGWSGSSLFAYAGRQVSCMEGSKWYHIAPIKAPSSTKNYRYLISARKHMLWVLIWNDMVLGSNIFLMSPA